LDRNGFRAKQCTHYPCIRENHPANGELQRGRSSAFQAAPPRRTRTAADPARELRNGIRFVSDRVDWFFSARASPPEYAAPPSCLGETSDGAPIIRSSARWFIGNGTPLRAGSPRRTTA
jgi:hypothetical protein